MTPEFVATTILRASLLLGLGLAALRWLPEARPQWRRAAALFCLAVSIPAPFLPLMHFQHGAGAISRWPGLDIANGHSIRVAQLLALIWGLGTALAALRLLRRGIALLRWINRCQKLDDVARLPRELGSLAIRVCDHAQAPCVTGFIRPVLIVPSQARVWDETTWRCVLAHEWQHVRQGDLWLGWIAHVARVFYWWHPLVWSLTRRMGLECEACCDEAVLRRGVKTTDYAKVLLNFANVDVRHPAPAFSIHGRTPSSLRLRVERLLTGGSTRAPAWRAFALGALLLVGVGSCFWLGVERANPNDDTAQKDEAQTRWSANPFPAD